MKRYAMGFFRGAPAMFEQPDGEYVKWSDVQALVKPANPPIPTNPTPLDRAPPVTCMEQGCTEPAISPVHAWCKEHDRKGAFLHG